jgi:hypothetical protein
MPLPFPLPLDTSRQSSFTTPLRLLLATTAALWLGTTQPQVATSVTSRQLTELRFRDFFRTPLEPTGLDISDALRQSDGQSDGQSVRLIGYMVQQESATPGRFLLTPRPLQINANAPQVAALLPPATVLVYLDPAQQDWAIPHVNGLVTVNGKLSVSTDELDTDPASWVRLQLDTEAAHSMSAFELTGYLHGRSARPINPL